MSYLVLARKLRPQKFDEIIGQEHITKSLVNSLKNNNIAHAYLFTGTRGIGKTTAARIFSKALTCNSIQDDFNPCGVCPSCKSIDQGSSMDVQEIDGASNNGVDQIRQLVENVHYLPVGGRKKVYIIDEVHMLSASAFNALLKTLEEPPEHVVFILATTEPAKILNTVLSRCQRFDFRTASIETLLNYIKEVLVKENIGFDSEELIKKICRLGKGSFRDTLTLLDQVLSFSTERHIAEATVSRSLGIAKTSSLKDVVSSLLMGDDKACAEVFKQSLSENVDLVNFTQGILDYIYFIIEKMDNPKSLYQHNVIKEGSLDNVSGAELFWIFEILAKDFTWAMKSVDPEKVSEIILRKVSLRREFFNEKSSGQNIAVTQTSQPQEVVEEKKTEELVSAPSSTKDWDGFIHALLEEQPALAHNLEQGNILPESSFSSEKIHIVLGFDRSSEIFYDYLIEDKIKLRVKNHIAEYFEIEKESIDLDFEKLDDEKKEKISFQKRSDIAEQKEMVVAQKKEEELKNDPYVLEAQTLFNSKVDKVILRGQGE